jgi:NhaA family Na+:H+ antiporter
MERDRPTRIRRLLGDPVGDFLTALLAQETIGGFVLAVALAMGVLWATAASSSYGTFIHASIQIPGVPSSVVDSTETLVTNLVMVIFFAAIGLEIARERAVGAMRDLTSAVAPVVAALGGMAMAALSFSVVIAATGDHAALRGWGIPMATDVAFTLGALSLVGSRVSRELRVFLLALAVADDVASVVLLALTGHAKSSLSPAAAMLWGLECLAALAIVLIARRRMRFAWLFVLAAALLWWGFAHLGIEPPLAGVVVGVAVPSGDAPSVVGLRLERALAPLSAFVVLPLFALVVGGVDLSARPWSGQGGLILALLLARTLGKLLGIIGAVAIVTRLRVGRLPEGTSWIQMAGAALLCGIGFTVPLLFATQAFSGSSAMVAASKVALLAASVLCAALGLAVIATGGKATSAAKSEPVPRPDGAAS